MRAWCVPAAPPPPPRVPLTVSLLLPLPVPLNPASPAAAAVKVFHGTFEDYKRRLKTLSK